MTTIREAAQQALEQAEPNAYGYAARLAVAIWEQHYKDTAPDWKPLDDLMGVLTQIDNMTAGLTRQEQAEPAQEPVAWQWLDTAHCRKKIPTNTTPSEWRPLFTAPPQRKPLTREEIMDLCASQWAAHPVEVARLIERAHGIGGQE